MKFNLVLLIIVFKVFLFNQIGNKSECDELEKGTYVLLENDAEIGKIYRENGIQIETYIGETDHEIVKYANMGNCEFYIRSNQIKQAVDTITWTVNYQKMSASEYKFIAKPLYYKDIQYSYEGKLKKVSNEIDDKNIVSLFFKLGQN